MIAVLRFQTSLHNFYNRLNDLAQSENKAELLSERKLSVNPSIMTPSMPRISLAMCRRTRN